MKKLGHFIYQLIYVFISEGSPTQAASLAYTTLLTLVPLLMVFIWILSFFPFFKGAGHAIQQFIVDNFIADSAAIISKHISAFLSQIQRMTWTNLISLFVTSMLMMYNIVTSFNSIWHVKMERHFAFSFLIYLLILLFSPLIFGSLFLFSSYLSALLVTVHAPSNKYLLWLFSLLVTFLIFTFFNWVVPSCHVKWRAAVVGGLVTTILFESAKRGFALYIAYYPTYQLIYGALATVLIFLIWLYITWVIILFGALVSRVVQQGFLPNQKMS
jgi:membrane protein